MLRPSKTIGTKGPEFMYLMMPGILADQLILSQPGEADYAHHITIGPDFQTFLRPCNSTQNLFKIKEH